MANNKFDLQAFFDNMEGKTWSLGSAFKRADALPLDLYSVWETKEEAETYAAEHPTAYPGQTLIVVEKEGEGTSAVDKIKLYYIDENRELQEVGAATLGDGETIVLDPETKILSIKGYADAEAGTKLVKTKDAETGEMFLAWLPDNQASLDADLETIKRDQEQQDDRLEKIENHLNSLGSIFNFVGEFTAEDVLKDTGAHNAQNYQVGDVCIVDNTEYVCVEKTTEEYVLSTDTKVNPTEKYYEFKDNIYQLVTSFEDDTSPVEEGYYERVKEWQKFGDPDGVTALQGRMDAAEKNIVDLGSAIDDINNLIGELPTDTDPYDNIIDYIDRQDAATLNSANSYTDGKVKELADGQVKTNKEAISGINEQITNINSGIEGLGLNKADKATFENYVSTNDAAVAKKLGKDEAASTYLTQESAKSLYYENAKGVQLESDLDVVEAIVNEIDTTSEGTTKKGKGNAQLRTDLDDLTTKVATNTTNTNTNTDDIAANGLAIAGLKSRADALDAKDVEHTSAIEAANNNITANTNAIKAIYDKPDNGDATGYLPAEIKRATAAEIQLGKDIAAEADRATKAEAALAARAQVLESYKDTNDARVEDVEEAINLINTTTIPNAKTEVKKYSDDNLAAGKNYTDGEITKVNAAISVIQDEIGDLANVMHFAGMLAASETGAGEYQITEITSIAASSSADEGLTIVSKKSFDKGDVGIYGQKEYVCIAIDDDKEDSVYTSTWTAIGDVGATSALIDGLQASKLDVTAFENYKTTVINPKFNEFDQKDNALNSAIEAEVERAELAENGLDNRLKAVETKSATNATNIATNVTNIAANAKAIEELDTELTSYIESLLEWGSF